jgi:hypothetical protein
VSLLSPGMSFEGRSEWLREKASTQKHRHRSTLKPPLTRQRVAPPGCMPQESPTPSSPQSIRRKAARLGCMLPARPILSKPENPAFMLPRRPLRSGPENPNCRPLLFLTSQQEESIRSLLITPVAESIRQKLARRGWCNSDGRGFRPYGFAQMCNNQRS